MRRGAKHHKDIGRHGGERIAFFVVDEQVTCYIHIGAMLKVKAQGCDGVQ